MFVTPSVLRDRNGRESHGELLYILLLKTSHRKQAPLPARKFIELRNLPPAPSGGERARLAPLPCTDQHNPAHFIASPRLVRMGEQDGAERANIGPTLGQHLANIAPPFPPIRLSLPPCHPTQ